MSRLALWLCAAFIFVIPATAAAQDGMPGQDALDAPAGPGSGMTSGTWADLPGGVSARPFVKSLTVVNGDQATPVFSGGTGAAGGVQIGDVTAVVSPVNLCAAGTAPAPGVCYATPNRVAIAFGYRTDFGLGRDFSDPSVPLRQIVTEDTLFDVVIGLNTLGQTLRWTWANGALDGWKTSGLGSPDAEVRLRIRPSVTPAIDWQLQSPGGCTATPIRDCNIMRADGELLASELVLSLDDTLSPALTGAVFATQGAIAGFLTPGGTPSAPVLDLQMASAHLAADGTLQHGTLRAFLPAQALLGLYGVLPADATSFFTATRRGDPGTQDAPRFAARSASTTSDDGLLVTVDNVTFSAPTYRVARKVAPARVRAAVRGARTGVSVAPIAACRRRSCSLTVYRTTGRIGARAIKVATVRSDARGAALARVASAKLPRRAQYIAVLLRGGKLVTSTRGTVS